MQALSITGQQAVDELSRRHGFGTDAVGTLLAAVDRGQGSMAQFSHPEFGGSGQWMRGGMTMLGDMFDHRLKGRVADLCADLSSLLADRFDLFARPSGASGAPGRPFAGPEGAWWPDGLGAPDASGSQNGARYAYFAGPSRLVIEANGTIRVHDTLDHRIGGVSQQQSSGSSLTFTSQHRTVDVATLPVVPDGNLDARPAAPTWCEPAPTEAAIGTHSASPSDHESVFSALDKLAAAHARGILTDVEFSAKKAELLRRI